jgi:hypothetical protein
VPYHLEVILEKHFYQNVTRLGVTDAILSDIYSTSYKYMQGFRKKDKQNKTK